MNKIFFLLTVFFINQQLYSQQVMSWQLDTISGILSGYESGVKGKSFKDADGTVFELDFPNESFKIWSHDRLASRAVYKTTATGEVLELTENIDLSKVTGIAVGDDYAGVVNVRLVFPPGHLKTQLLKDGAPAGEKSPDYLDLYCKYGAVDEDKMFLFDKMFFYLYGICTGLNIEKGVFTSQDVENELREWLKGNDEAFAKSYPESILNLRFILEMQKKP